MLRSSPILAGLEVQPARLGADVERLIPKPAVEIRAAVQALPKTLAAGKVDLARQELRGYLGAVRVIAEPTRMLF